MASRSWRSPSPIAVIEDLGSSVLFDFPLEHVVGRSEIALPLEMWFYLSIRTSPGKSAVVAMTGPLEFTVR